MYHIKILSSTETIAYKYLRDISIFPSGKIQTNGFVWIEQVINLYI